MSKVIEINDPQFEEEVMSADKPVLVYFWASWCGPCRLVSPSISALAEQYGDRLKVVKLEVDPNPESVGKCQVEGVPAFRFFKNKTLVHSYEGAIGKQQIQTMIENIALSN
jgi:thioredoxin 1